jgi:hypothetical protein
VALEPVLAPGGGNPGRVVRGDVVGRDGVGEVMNVSGKICPLLAIACHIVRKDEKRVDSSCHGEVCAWWNTEENECTILTLGKAFNKGYLNIRD